MLTPTRGLPSNRFVARFLEWPASGCLLYHHRPDTIARLRKRGLWNRATFVWRPDQEKPKKKAVEAAEHTLKLAIRLNEGVNDALRSLIRYRGDLSGMALDALKSVGLGSVGLVSAEEKMVRDTTITIPRSLHKELKKIATDRKTSMNILVNTALAHWLAKKGALRLR